MTVEEEAFVEQGQFFENMLFAENVVRAHGRRTRAGVIRHWKGFNRLLLAMKQREIDMGVNYTYVIYHKDDFLWMHPFRIEDVLAAVPLNSIGTPGQAHFYTHFCFHQSHLQVMESLMIFERQAASSVLERVYDELLLHHPPHIDCVESLLTHIVLQSKHVIGHMMAAGLIPGHRMGHVNNKFCLHKFCNSCNEAIAAMDMKGLTICSSTRKASVGTMSFFILGVLLTL